MRMKVIHQRTCHICPDHMPSVQVCLAAKFVICPRMHALVIVTGLFNSSMCLAGRVNPNVRHQRFRHLIINSTNTPLNCAT
jgi:hypothetical protein